MRKRVNVAAVLLLILSTCLALGDGNKTRLTKTNQKTNIKGKASDRAKRSINLDNDDKQFLINRVKRQIINKDLSKNKIDTELNRKFLILENKVNDELPFWGNRGRRSSEENYVDANSLSASNEYDNLVAQRLLGYPSSKDIRQDLVPFWGNRGRRNSDEIPDDYEITGPFWSSKGRRQEDEPFWGNRGRRDDEPFWGNRGRRQDDDPFWGNRGKKEDPVPFLGNRGNKGIEDSEPFWGNRGKKEIEEFEPFWGNRGRRKEDLKESITQAINKVEHDIDNLSRLKKGNNFWANRGRDSQLKYLFDGTRVKNQHSAGPLKSAFSYELSANPSVSSTVMDDRIYADQPHYITVERSSRSSAELDPFFISRGKKNNSFQLSRGRRGAIEEIFKTVRNDPFYIARGKKDEGNQICNITKHNAFLKAKELICATIELMLEKTEGEEVKREINENDRDRRNALKKLAAQLQNDPYFVSRGKKNGVKENDIEEFIHHVASMCH